jgi:membrane-associated phospholipid phosphatase
MNRTQLGSLSRGARLAALLLVLAHPGWPSPLRPTVDWTRDGVVTGAAGLSVLTLTALQGKIAPLHCRWCAPPAFDGKIANRVPWGDPNLASRGSDVMVVGVGGGALGYLVASGYARGDREAGWANALIVTEATSVALVLNTGAKYALARQRPYAWQGRPELAASPRDQNLSFFSQHTTFAFAVAASSTTLLAEQGDPHAAWFGATAFTAAGLTGYLRMAGRQHYLSDVLIGAGVGTFVGWAVPHWFHRPIQLGRTQITLLPAPNGIAGVF